MGYGDRLYRLILGRSLRLTVRLVELCVLGVHLRVLVLLEPVVWCLLRDAARLGSGLRISLR